MIYLRSILFECAFVFLTFCLALVNCILGLFNRRIIIATGRVWGRATTLLLRLRFTQHKHARARACVRVWALCLPTSIRK